jgi:hypothetical protein
MSNQYPSLSDFLPNFVGKIGHFRKKRKDIFATVAAKMSERTKNVE